MHADDIYFCIKSIYVSHHLLVMNARMHCIYRGVVAVDANLAPGDGGDSLEDVMTDGPVLFCHDPRLQLPSFVYHTPEQVRFILEITSWCSSNSSGGSGSSSRHSHIFI